MSWSRKPRNGRHDWTRSGKEANHRSNKLFPLVGEVATCYTMYVAGIYSSNISMNVSLRSVDTSVAKGFSMPINSGTIEINTKNYIYYC